MAKKSFRARVLNRPDYPRLVELGPGTLQRWGLAALGGLLIGGSGCAHTPPASTPAAETPSRKLERAHPDAGLDGDEPTLQPPTGGVPPPARLQHDDEAE